MTAHARALGIITLLLVSPLASANADLDADGVGRGKRATALIETKDGGSGSAFCVDAEAGLFVTNAHAVGGDRAEGKPDASHVRLVIASGEDGQKIVTARVLRASGGPDLAVLQIDPAAAADLTALELGDDAKLVETQPLTAFGYPFGRWLTRREDEYPSISVSTGRVTSLRKDKGALALIQLDNALNPGNSGGPVLDASGKVVGVVVAGIPGSGVNFALPVRMVRSFLATPVVTFSPEAVSHDERSQPRTFTINVVSFDKAAAKEKTQVELVVDPGGERERRLAASPVEGSRSAFAVSAPLVVPRDGPPRVRLTARYADGAVSCVVEDVEVKVRDRTFKLSQIRRAEQRAGEPPKVVLDGEILRDRIEGPAELKGDLGGPTIVLNLGKATSFEVDALFDAVSEVPYRVVVKRDEKVIGELAGAIPVTGAPLTTVVAAPAAPVAAARLPSEMPAKPAPTDPPAADPDPQTPPKPSAKAFDDYDDRTGAPEFKPPDLRPDGQRVVQLPGQAEHVVAGGGGRFLIFYLKMQAKLAVFDVSRAEVVKLITLPAGDVAYAAGLTKLMVGLRDANTIQRWDLNTLEREVTGQGPAAGFVTMAMGYDSNGPLYVSGAKNGTAFELDPRTLRGKAMPWEEHGHSPGTLACSADGRLVVGYNFPGYAAVRTLLRSGPGWGGPYSGGYINYTFMLPSADGSVIFDTIFDRDRGKIWTPDMATERYAEGVPGAPAPTYDAGYFVTFGKTSPGDLPKLVVHNAGDFKPVTTRTDFVELLAEAPKPLQPHHRIHLYPQHRLLVTIGAKGEEVTIREFDVLKELDESGLDYLMVTSRTPWAVVKGERYRYPVRVLSKRGGTKLTLESSPPGMTLSPQGVLAWTPPTTFKEKDVSVTLLVTDASGQEVLHAFGVRVLDPVVPK